MDRFTANLSDPAKIANYLIARLDFQAPYLKKAQFTRSNIACLDIGIFENLLKVKISLEILTFTAKHRAGEKIDGCAHVK